MIRDERAVVGILSMVLVLGIVAIVITYLNVDFFPSLIKNNEASHMREVGNQFSEMVSRMEMQAIFEVEGVMASPITLGSKTLWFPPSSGTIGVEQSGSVHLNATNAFVRVLEGKDYSAVGQGVTHEISQGTEETNIAKITYFMLTINVNNIGTNDYALVNVSVYDKDGDYVGSAVVKFIKKAGSKGQEWTGVYLIVSNSTTEYLNQPVSWYYAENDISNYRINLLNPNYRFTEVLSSAETPLTLSFTYSSNGPEISADYTIVYETQEGDEVGVGGKLKNIDLTYLCNAIKFSSSNLRFIDQSYVFECSGTILHQEDGNIFYQLPSISFDRRGTKTEIDMLIINVIPKDYSEVSGNRLSSVKTKFRMGRSTVFETNTLNLTIITNYQNAWYEYLDNSLQKLGFEKGVDYEISKGKNVSLKIYGVSKDGERDIEVHMKYAEIEAEIGIRG
ncbi:hypothetical protein Asulf_00250 [Archaeoglobus sulfaticallidus PM70-1]|uniref:Uncharacterized protein n=1 Tax=Archaeoglobus sulfaticallidus PM70-1 TaxID=387631 RepID=N0BB98_9EURY|nr:hypothetical protein [Archaeoglobus sulfaticallidus]AGK60283.1 hypothetical protein Asulf_00250 [Archaeoglobus sulfaticallidus PM70-1]